MATTFDAESTDQDDYEGELPSGSGALMAFEKAQIDMQISTARQFPRSIKMFKQQAMEMACLDEETAASMFYVLPRAGKKIEGPSIRMAEVVGSCYGNLRYGARIVATDDRFITAQGACHDLEKNIAITYEVKRRITNKAGVRFNDDMIQTTGNAALSIALREAIFRVVPRSLFKAIYEEAKLTSIGKATSMNEKRHKAMDWFKKAGASETQVLEFLGRKGLDEIDTDDLISLRGLVTAIKDGEITIEAALAPQNSAVPGSKAKTSPLNDKLSQGANGSGKHVESTKESESAPGDPFGSRENDGLSEEFTIMIDEHLENMTAVSDVRELELKYLADGSGATTAEKSYVESACLKRANAIRVARSKK